MYTPQVNVFSWYDAETTGIDRQMDQILQAAFVQTDSELNIIKGSEVNVIGKPRPDVIPHPKAFLTHFLDIDTLNGSGMSEFMLTKLILDEFNSNEKTAIAGYNTNNYDNEIVRNMAFRNMKGPYDHEWRDGNLKFDSFKLIQMVYALRPEILTWRNKPDGKTSLKLADLSIDNGIEHINAHDALDDVYACIGLTKLIKEANPRLFNHVLQLTQKKNVSELVSQHNAKRMPLLHIDTVYGQESSIGTLIYPIAIDKNIKDKYITLDLRHDPSHLLDMSPEDIRETLYTKKIDLPENSPEIPIVSIASNKQPNIVSPNGLIAKFAEKSNLNLDSCKKNMDFINKNRSEFTKKLQDAMDSENTKKQDVYRTLYSGGFISKGDTAKRYDMHLKSSKSTNSNEISFEKISCYDAAVSMDDSVRHFELMMRSKWNSFHEKLLSTGEFSPTEFIDWVDYLEDKLNNGLGDDKVLTFKKFKEEMSNIEMESPLDENSKKILGKLEKHVNQMKLNLDSLVEVAKELKSDSNIEIANSESIKTIKNKIFSSNKDLLENNEIELDVASVIF